ncbi:MAG TPA: alpha/beta hydrolase [Parvibaculum sp.]
MTAPYREVFYTTQDGLRLFAKDFGPRGSKPTPVICLPGLTRNSKDFDELATHLSASRRVICPDLRGRGRSQYCDGWADYTPQTEMLDVFDLMGALGLHQAAFIGTSRGGIIAMLMAAQRPNAIRAATLVDIGPEVALDGLKRIASYAGVMEAPESWTEAAFKLRMMNERDFPTLTGDDWYVQARRTFAERDGAPKLDYDPKIGVGLRKGLEAANGSAPPPMWPQFKALSHVPLLTIRGENSDILSAETLRRMGKEHPKFSSVTVKDRGHVPFLDEPEALAALDAFFSGIA